MNSSIFKELRQMGSIYEQVNTFSMYSSVILIMLGFAGNVFALVVLIYARNKTPRIIGLNYLVLLTITNTVFLLLHLYMNTYSRIIYYFDIDYQKSMHFLDSSLVFCKSLLYSKSCARFLNTVLTVGFSLERLVAVYKPLHVRSLDTKSFAFFKTILVASFFIPSYFVYFSVLVPNDQVSTSIYNRYNLSRSINMYSLTPIFGKSTCGIDQKTYPLFLKLHFIMFLIILLSYLFTSVSILAIVAKLKTSRSFIFSYRSRTPTSSVASQQTEMRNDSFTVRMSRQVKNLGLINYKIQDTKLLTSVSLGFVVFNTPYFLVMLFTMVFAIQNYEANSSNLLMRIKVQFALVITEVIQLMNFSFTGLLFFCSGQIFRIHALNCFKRVFY